MEGDGRAPGSPPLLQATLAELQNDRANFAPPRA